MAKRGLILLLLLITQYSIAALNISSYNIRNFDYDERMRMPTNKSKLKEIISSLRSDLIAVQEINKTEVFKSFIGQNFPHYQSVLSQCGGHHDQRLGFVYNPRKLQLVNFVEDDRVSNPNHPQDRGCRIGSRPLAIAEFKMLENNSEHLVAISLHLKSGGRGKSVRKRFAQHAIIQEVVREYKRRGVENFIIMGDFNSTEYIKKGNTQMRFKRSVQNMGLKDMAENLACSSYWWGGRNDGIEYPSLLDHILVSPSLLPKSRRASIQLHGHCKALRCAATRGQDMGIGYDQVSDHCPLSVQL